MIQEYLYVGEQISVTRTFVTGKFAHYVPTKRYRMTSKVQKLLPHGYSGTRNVFERTIMKLYTVAVGNDADELGWVIAKYDQPTDFPPTYYVGIRFGTGTGSWRYNLRDAKVYKYQAEADNNRERLTVDFNIEENLKWRVLDE